MDIAFHIARRYIQNYNLENLLDVLIELIDKHIDNEPYVFQGLYCISSCFELGNVNFYSDKLLSLLRKCTQYVATPKVFSP